MKFKKNSIPKPSVGMSFEGQKDMTVPDQTIKLEEILRRFIRQEALPIGHEGVYGSSGEIDPESDSEFNIDVEKARSWDLTEKAEFSDRVKAAKEVHDKEEKKRLDDEAKKKEEADQKAFDKRVRIAARKLSKEGPGPKAPGSI